MSAPPGILQFRTQSFRTHAEQYFPLRSTPTQLQTHAGFDISYVLRQIFRLRYRPKISPKSTHKNVLRRAFALRNLKNIVLNCSLYY